MGRSTTAAIGSFGSLFNRQAQKLMFPGHFAAGLSLKVVEPRASTLGLMIGVGFLELLFGVFVAAGPGAAASVISVHAGRTPC